MQTMLIKHYSPPDLGDKVGGMVIDRPYNKSQSFIESLHLQVSSSSAAILVNFSASELVSQCSCIRGAYFIITQLSSR